MTWMQWSIVLAPGSWVVLRPPAFQLWVAFSFVITQSRVRSLPHALAAVAHSRNDEVETCPP